MLTYVFLYIDIFIKQQKVCGQLDSKVAQMVEKTSDMKHDFLLLHLLQICPNFQAPHLKLLFLEFFSL